MLPGTKLAPARLCSTIRDLIEMEGEVVVHLDLQPDLSAEQVAERLARRRPKDSGTTALRKAGLAPVGIGLLREATANELPSDPVDLASLVKATPLRLVGADLHPVVRKGRWKLIAKATHKIKSEVDGYKFDMCKRMKQSDTTGLCSSLAPLRHLSGGKQYWMIRARRCIRHGGIKDMREPSHPPSPRRCPCRHHFSIGIRNG